MKIFLQLPWVWRRRPGCRKTSWDIPERARFVGHGVGLELDELPVLAQKFKIPLEAGQTIEIEPKFVFPGRGVVGIENTIAITAAGCERLTDFSDQIVYL